MQRIVSVALLVLALSLAACTARPQAESAPPPPPPAVSTADVRPIPNAKRAAQLPEGMPIEVPVPDGRVTRSDADNRGAGIGLWLYDLETSHTPEVTASWYQKAYRSRQWQLTDARSEGTRDSVTYVYRFRKGSTAETLLRIRASGEGTHVESSVSLGVPLDNES